jgi:hypothetical protein
LPASTFVNFRSPLVLKATRRICFSGIGGNYFVRRIEERPEEGRVQLYKNGIGMVLLIEDLKADIGLQSWQLEGYWRIGLRLSHLNVHLLKTHSQIVEKFVEEYHQLFLEKTGRRLLMAVEEVQ